MSKNQATQHTPEHLAAARASVARRRSTEIRQWVEDEARRELAARRFADEADGGRRRSDKHDHTTRVAGFDRHEVREHAARHYDRLAEAAEARMVEALAAARPHHLSAAAAAESARNARNTCPVCGQVSKWGHRVRRLFDAPVAGAGEIDSCMPCFLTAQREWLDLQNADVPDRITAVRAAVRELIR